MVSRFSLFPTLPVSGLGVGKNLGGNTGQVAHAGQKDIPYCVASCSAVRNGIEEES